MNPNSSKASLTPRSTKRHRQAADARWRANMYVCFALLKHSSKEAMQQTAGKITRIGALKQAYTQLPLMELKLSQLLEARNQLYGTRETIQTVKDDFSKLTQLTQSHAEMVKKSIKLVQKCSRKDSNLSSICNDFISAPASICNSRCTSRAASEMSDISSFTDDLPYYLNHSPLLTSTQVSSRVQAAQSESDTGVLEDNELPIEITDYFSALADDQLSVIKFEAESQVAYSEEEPKMSDVPTLYESLNAEEFIDLSMFESILASKKRPASPDTPLARTRSPAETLLIRSPKVRRLFWDQERPRTNEAFEKGNSDMSVSKKLLVKQEPQDLDVHALDESFSVDVAMYDDSPSKSSVLRSNSDPMVSSNDIFRPVCVRPAREPQDIVSPWKMEEVKLDSYNILH